MKTLMLLCSVPDGRIEKALENIEKIKVNYHEDEAVL